MNLSEYGGERCMEKKNSESERGTVYYWIGGNRSKDSRCIVFTHGMTADHTMFDMRWNISAKNIPSLRGISPFMENHGPMIISPMRMLHKTLIGF